MVHQFELALFRRKPLGNNPNTITSKKGNFPEWWRHRTYIYIVPVHNIWHTTRISGRLVRRWKWYTTLDISPFISYRVTFLRLYLTGLRRTEGVFWRQQSNHRRWIRNKNLKALRWPVKPSLGAILCSVFFFWHLLSFTCNIFRNCHVCRNQTEHKHLCHRLEDRTHFENVGEMTATWRNCWLPVLAELPAIL
jgi:hypothetical protein